MFHSREEAGNILAGRLGIYKSNRNCIVFGIPRGGMVVAYAIAEILHIPLSALIVKKLRAPENPELAIGAVSMGGVKYIDAALALRIGVTQEYLDAEVKKKQEEVREKEKKFQISNFKFQISKNTIILVDDGVATGSTILAAIRYIKQKTKDQRSKTHIVLAVPVIAKDTLKELQSEVDEIAAIEIPESFGSVGQYYEEFPQVTDEEVKKLI